MRFLGGGGKCAAGVEAARRHGHEPAAGAGVAELVDAIVKDDLRERACAAPKSRVLIGHARDAKKPRATTREPADRYCPAHGTVALLAGESGCGKSTACAGLLERLAGMHQQLCIIDPEGDYQNDEDTIVIGDAAHRAGHR